MSPRISSLHQVAECFRHCVSHEALVTTVTMVRLVLTVVIMVRLVVAMVRLAPVTSRRGVKLSLGPVVDTLEQG